MQAMSGTAARSASTTAGWSSTAAVPLVVSTMAGRPLALPMPSAVKAAERSSRRTCTLIRSSAASAIVRGVERDPGHTTAWVTPQRTHSSTSVAANAAWTSPSAPPSGALGTLTSFAMSSTPTSEPARPPDLHRRTIGDGPGLVLAHGFTQTGRVWASLDDDLAADHRVTSVDMPGHGGSATVAVSLPAGGGLLGAVGGRAAYVGYSMGARFCLHLALDRPDLVDALVLISGTAGIDDPDERRLRRRADEALAEQLDPSTGTGSAVPVEAFVRRWMDDPMFDGVGPEAGGLRERLTNTGPGLASSLRLAGTGTQQPRWGELERLAMPVLVVTGERDLKFTPLGRRLVGCIGSNASLTVVPGTGHAPHLQRPGEVAALVRAHLAGGSGTPSPGPG